MENVEMDKETLRGILTTNRDKHLREYAEAVAGWAAKLAKQANDIAEFLRTAPEQTGDGWVHAADKMRAALVALSPPTNSVRYYDRALLMLEHEIRPTVVLTETEFSQYVQDEWHWSRDFRASYSHYSGTAQS